MKERPILFSAPMVRALLDGSKNQTRRVAKLTDAAHVKEPRGHRRWHPGDPAASLACPYGQPGDRLWVKETTVNVEDHGYEGPVFAESDDGRTVIEYGLAPSEDDCTEVEPEDIKLRPSIFMPRAMSRITLEITRVRVERLQDICFEDAMDEGVVEVAGYLSGLPACSEHRYAYEDLWREINGPRSWDLNPWVWIIEFQRVQP